MADETVSGEAPVDGVPITLNGREVIADKGELLINVAARNGVYVPRFCYHERMNPVGMCRACLVEVDAGRGPALQPSCMLECSPGMVVDTESDVARKAQDGVLEYLLINHPLDCPVCDKAGECPLQDLTMGYGPGESRYVEEKRHYEKPIPVSDLVLLDQERCILCDRCTRFAKEVAGDPLIHFMNRGNQTVVNTFPDEPFSSYFSGNTVQICPVGALTSKTYRFKARPWDLEKTESTCTACSVGCRISVESSRDEVLRYTGVDVDPVNWGWLCDKGRYGFQVVGSDRRLTEPLARVGDSSEPIRWNEALRRAADAIRGGLERSGPEGIAVLGGARLTNEDIYAWVKFAKGVLGTDNLDAQLGDGLPAELIAGLPRATIDQACRPGGTVIVLAPDLKEELPVLFLRLRHAVTQDGATVVEIAPMDSGTATIAASSLRCRPGEAAEVAKVLVGAAPADREIAGVAAADLAKARGLIEAADGPVTVILGRQSLAEDPGAFVDAAGVLLSGLPGVRFLSALRRGNVHGAIDLGMAPGLLPGRVDLDTGREWYSEAWPTVPQSRGLDALGILNAAAAGRIDTLILLGADPLTDFPDRDLAERALAGARTVIATDAFLSESSALADIVLPAAGFTEVEGTTTNLESRVSVLNQRVTPPGSARTDWMVAIELAERLGADMDLESTIDIWNEIERLSSVHAGVTWDLLHGPDGADGVVVPLETAGIESVSDPVQAVLDGPDQVPEDAVSDPAVDDGPDEATDEERADPGPTRPEMVVHVPASPSDPPALDSYSLRLISARRLYDDGMLVAMSPALSGLVAGTVLRVNEYDFGRMGVVEGADVRISTAKATVTLPVHIDNTIPRGAAAILFNQPPVHVSSLIDANQRVTDVRIEASSGADNPGGGAN